MVHIEALDHRNIVIASRIHAVLLRAHAQEAELLQLRRVAPLELTVEDIQAGNEAYFGALHGQTLLGAVSLEADDEPNQVLIASLIVHPEHQRQGIGRSLVLRALGTSDEMCFAVATTAHNLPALSLYRGLGFVEYRYGTIGPENLGLVKLRRARSGPSVDRTSGSDAKPN